MFLFVPSEDAQVIRFQSGDTDVLSRFSAENFAVLQKQQGAKGYHLDDLGPGLEYNFLFFNLNDLGGKSLPEIAKKQGWFQDVRFRQAVSAAIDREGIVRLVYGGRATAIWDQVTPGNKLWVDDQIAHPKQSVERARELLQSAGFSWKQRRAGGSARQSRGVFDLDQLVERATNENRDDYSRRLEPTGDDGTSGAARFSRHGGPAADEL